MRRSVSSTTAISSRRDLSGGDVPTVVIEIQRTSADPWLIEMSPAQARALARKLNQAARALS